MTSPIISVDVAHRLNEIIQNTLDSRLFLFCNYEPTNPPAVSEEGKYLVAVQDLEDDNTDVIFVRKERSEYYKIFEDVQTVASICDDFVKQLRLFTEKQNIPNIEPHGYQKTILLKE